MRYRFCFVGLLVALSATFLSGCGRGGDGGKIRVEGSDTMVNVAQAWAEAYGKKRPEVKVQVLGGGSGVGIASLIDGNCDMANSSRKLEPKEIEKFRAKHPGAEPIEHIVGYDALAVYVHKDNPMDSISMEELAEIYGDGGKITKWSEMGVQIKTQGSDQISVVSRQNSSGTYLYFQEAVLGKKRDFRLGTLDQSGSKDVVDLVSTTPGAIGYSGMGYATKEVKMLKVSKKKGELGVAPTVENAKSGSYPITRPLQIYTVGQPSGAIKQYLDWIHSAEGQKVVADLGYVPL